MSDQYLRRYVGPRPGRVAHLVEPNMFDRRILSSLCGVATWRSAWLGTGNWLEVERLKELPDCKKCELRRKDRED